MGLVSATLSIRYFKNHKTSAVHFKIKYIKIMWDGISINIHVTPQAVPPYKYSILSNSKNCFCLKKRTPVHFVHVDMKLI